jgi:hypothetical protein
MKSKLASAVIAVALLAPASYGGDPSGKAVILEDPIEIQAPVAYEAGRGLITLEGPSGMFINPTSATLPSGAFTAQYCFFLPNNDFDTVGHGLMASYGVTDFIELGVIGNYLDNAADPVGFGPMARLRLLKDEGYLPQLAVGGFSRFSDNAGFEKHGAFLAAYKRLPISEDGFVRSLGIHAGIKQLWLDNADSFSGYGGLELQFPFRVYLVGEVQTKDNDINAEVPYAFGVQWRLGGINISVAGIQNGNLDEPGFYFGIGSALTF